MAGSYVPHFEEPWDGLEEDTCAAVLEIAAGRYLSAIGFNREPGAVEEYRPRSKCFRPAKSQKNVRSARQSRLQERPESERLARIEQVQRELAKAARQRAEQEKIAIGLAQQQLHLIGGEIRRLLSAGDPYRARLMRAEAARVLQNYPQLSDLWKTAKTIGLFE
jgi:hypothetical protein